ncbi:MAG: hypothetical protein JRN39_03000 [Nitrososphaerota archaeon]|nr:hypothetical protein [Nitrososphaerota archaeon]
MDIYDERYVFWAVGNRARPAEDWVIVKDVVGSIADPSIPGHVGSKAGIDATLPVGEAYEIPTLFPKEAMQAVRLYDFVDRGKVEAMPDAYQRQVEVD